MNYRTINPVWYDPSVMNIRYGGGQKHLRYIIQIYISQFKSDYSGVKSKSEVHTIQVPSREKIARRTIVAKGNHFLARIFELVILAVTGPNNC